jgi:hypothetical protein
MDKIIDSQLIVSSIISESQNAQIIYRSQKLSYQKAILPNIKDPKQ